MFKEGNPNQVPSQETQSIVEAPKPQLTEQELRDKYEINNRKRLARGFLAERQNIRKAEEVKKLQLLSQLESKKTQNSNDLKNLQSDPNKTVSEIEGRLLDIDSRVTRYTENISKRNFFDKLKFKVIKDEAQEAVRNLTEEKKLRLLALDKQNAALQQMDNDFTVKQENADRVYTQRLQDVTKESKLDKTSLYNRVRQANTESKSRIRNTFEAMERQELNVSLLAQKFNVLVVHSIPPDGWAMNNTSMNNVEVDATKLSAAEKTTIVREKKPDVSASIIGVDSYRHDKNTMYPFGYIVDGDVVASYDTDMGTITDGDLRRVKDDRLGTLQKDPVEMFARVAKGPVTGGAHYNEIIVHKPNIKGVLLDIERLKKPLGSTLPLVEHFSLDEESEIVKKYNSLQYEGQNVNIKKVTPESGKYAGQTRIVVSRIPNYLEKALESARTNNPDTPLYLQQKDGIYTLDGKKVTAMDIYGNAKV